MKLQSFYIYKLPSSYLKRKNYTIQLSLEQARKSGLVVSLGDSQMLRSLRGLTGHSCDPLEVSLLYSAKKRARKAGLPTLDIERRIDELLYVSAIVSIEVEDISHYRHLGVHGFTLNGVKYKRLLCGAGNARRNVSLWIDESYERPLKDILNNGRADIDIVPAKYSAYFALASSAGLPVSEPYFCVVKDYENTRTEQVDFITEVDGGDDIVEGTSKEIKFTPWDGQGIISPRLAVKWAEELGLDYVPSTFIVRSNFIKGMLAVIDFHAYSDDIGEHFIVDAWGNRVNIRDMDVILTQSQFKLWNAYESLSAYVSNCRANSLGWSVTRYSPKQDADYTFLNYQFVQALCLTDEQLEALCAPTVEYLRKVSKDDFAYSLLYLTGGRESDNPLEDTRDALTRSLMLKPELLSDPYVKKSLLRSINKKIKESYIGNLAVRGHYTMMVSDPYAFMEYIFGLEPRGLLARDEHFSSYWSDLGESHITAMRAPLTWRSEVVTANLKTTPQTSRWYAYLTSCIIYNIHGVDCLLHGGSD